MRYRINISFSTFDTMYGLSRYKGGNFHSNIDFDVAKDVTVDEKLVKEKADAVLDGSLDSGSDFMNNILEVYGAKKIYKFKIISFYRVLREGEKTCSSLTKKEKELIRKLLNLSVSDNENEAKLALSMATKLMKKHSLTESDLNAQEILTYEIYPKGKKMFSSWEISLYSELGRISGCYVTYRNKRKGDNKIFLSGYERDVFNLAYLAECYIREVKNLTSKKKKELSLDRKNTTDYRNGLVYGIAKKIQKENKDFFNQEEEKGLIPVDNRIDTIKDALGGKVRLVPRKTRVSRSTSIGERDAKNIHIAKATEDRSVKVEKIGR